MVDYKKEIKRLKALQKEAADKTATFLEKQAKTDEAEQFKINVLKKFGLYDWSETDEGWVDLTSSGISPDRYAVLKERIKQTAMTAKKRAWANELLDSMV